MIDNIQKNSLSELVDEIRALRQAMTAQQNELEALRAKVHVLEAEKSQLGTGHQVLAKATSRRKLLKLGGAAASLAALSSLGVAANRPQAAQAADGSFAVVSGVNLNSNAGSNATYFANNDPGGLSSILFRINNFSDRGITPPSPYKIALLATTGGSTTDRNPATRVGVYTATDNGFGLYSVVDQGVGVFAKSSGADATGVFANVSGLNATGVFALSSNGLGGYFSGGRAALLLAPSGNDPRTSPINHATGELYMDNAGNLWYCVAAGNPGTWRQLSGTNTGGSFHLLPASDRFVDTRPATQVGIRNTPIVAGPGVGVNFQITEFSGRDGNIVPNGATAVLGNIGLLPVSAGSTPVKLVASSVTDLTKGTATVSYNGTALSSTFSAALGPTGALKLIALGGGSFNVLIDIVGYFL